jgi:hypothetical protein
MDGGMMPFAEQAAKYGFVAMDHHKPNYFKVLESDMVGTLGMQHGPTNIIPIALPLISAN